MDALKNSVELATEIFNDIEERVNAALANPTTTADGKVVPPKMKDLRDEIAKEHGVEDTYAYSLLSAYLDQRDDVTVKPGRDGGIVPRAAEESRKQSAQEKRQARLQKAAERGAKAAQALAQLGVQPTAAADVNA